jgi:hypothetical protein
VQREQFLVADMVQQGGTRLLGQTGDLGIQLGEAGAAADDGQRNRTFRRGLRGGQGT